MTTEYTEVPQRSQRKTYNRDRTYNRVEPKIFETRSEPAFTGFSSVSSLAFPRCPLWSGFSRLSPYPQLQLQPQGMPRALSKASFPSLRQNQEIPRAPAASSHPMPVSWYPALEARSISER